MSSFYGGRPGNGFILVKEYQTKQAMITDFKKGANCPVHYDQYVLVKETTNNNTDIKIYRRGYNFTNSNGGAEQVGSLSEILNGESSGEILDARVGWNGTIYNSLGEAIRTQMENAFNGNALYIDAKRLSDLFSGDFNNFPNNRMCPINIDFTSSDAATANITAASAHAPDTGNTSIRGTLLTFGRRADRFNLDVQIFITQSREKMYVRLYDGENSNTPGTWSAWSVVGGSSLLGYLDPRLKILAVGDSICAGARNNNKGFVGDLGLPFQNAGLSSSALSTKNSSNVEDIPSKFIRFVNEHANWEPDIILANGGRNDYNLDAPLGEIPTEPSLNSDGTPDYDRLDLSTVMGGLQKLFLLMIEKYPKAQRFFVTTHKIFRTASKEAHKNGYAPTRVNGAGYTATQLNDAIIACCNVYGVKVIDIFNDSILDSAFAPYRYDANSNNNYFDSDGVHPLERGYLEGYVPLIQAALKGNTSGSYCSYQTLQNVRDQISKAVSGGNQFLNINKLVSLFSGDFNNIPNNRIYPVNIDFMGSDAASANITAASAHAPLPLSGGTLITLGRTVSESHQNGDVQIFTTPDGADWIGEILVREYWNEWNAWHSLTDFSKRVWKGLKISVLGDSISSYSGQSVGNAYYTSSKIPSVNSMWWKQLCKITGAEKLVVNAYASSCCAVASASWTNSITPAVDNSRCRALHTGSTSSGNRVDPDIILIAMGLNDFQANVPLGTWNGHEALSSSDTATWRGAYANMLLKIHTEYPNALVFCLSPWFFVRGNSTDVNVNSGGNSYQDFEDAMKEVCNILGGIYIDCSNFGFNRQNYSGSTFAINDNTNDGSYFHPNATGQEILGQSIAAAVKDKAVGYVNWLKAQRGI